MASSSTTASAFVSRKATSNIASTTTTFDQLTSKNNNTSDSVVQRPQHQQQSSSSERGTCTTTPSHNNKKISTNTNKQPQSRVGRQIVTTTDKSDVTIHHSHYSHHNTNTTDKSGVTIHHSHYSQHNTTTTSQDEVDILDDCGYRSGDSNSDSATGHHSRASSNLSHHSLTIVTNGSDSQRSGDSDTEDHAHSMTVNHHQTSSSSRQASTTGSHDKVLRSKPGKARDIEEADDEDDEVVGAKRARGPRASSRSSALGDDGNVISLRNRTLTPSSSLVPMADLSHRRSRRKQSSGGQHQDDHHHQHRPSPSIRSYFPLKTIGSVCELFRSQVAHSQQPNLTLLSIVIGLIEDKITNGSFGMDDEDSVHLYNIDNSLESHQTSQRQSYLVSGSYSPTEATPAPSSSGQGVRSALDIPIPIVRWDTVQALEDKFYKQIKESIDLSSHPSETITSELIKKIADYLLSNIHRSHCKDRAHLQTLYSYLTGAKLDSYGFAYAVLVACQALGFDDLRLVMSEDHVWGLLGDGETIEITWHSKGTEDRIGEPVPASEAENWLYLHGNTMVCDAHQVVATLVSAMNLSINALQDSRELALLQQQLLWILYDYGHLERYPMALGNLADLEDACGPASVGRRTPLELFHQSIDASKEYYYDCHVYPYTYLGGYYFRIGAFRQAFRLWAEAAGVIRKYNYSREDEEIYKEFQEIANDLIPHIVKTASPRLGPNGEPPLMQDAECFACLLRFYDGLCAWEEGSTTPVLHIGWSKPLVSTIAKFPHHVRSKVEIRVELADALDENEETTGGGSDFGADGEGSEDANKTLTIGERRRRRAASFGSRDHLRPLATSSATLPPPGENKENHVVIVASGVGYYTGKRVEDDEEDGRHEDEGGVWVVLGSKKMAGLKSLLTADKLNTSAIQLQLTAQSQVNISSKRNQSNALSLALGASRTPNTLLGSSTPKASQVFSEIDVIANLKDSGKTPIAYGKRQRKD